MKTTCFMDCGNPAVHSLAWRIRDRKTNISGEGLSATLAHSCEAHLAELTARARIIRLDTETTEWNAQLDALIKLEIENEDPTRAEAQAILDKVAVAIDKLQVYAAQYYHRANPASIAQTIRRD